MIALFVFTVFICLYFPFFFLLAYIWEPFADLTFFQDICIFFFFFFILTALGIVGIDVNFFKVSVSNVGNPFISLVFDEVSGCLGSSVTIGFGVGFSNLR